jgi:hypothetical protein
MKIEEKLEAEKIVSSLLGMGIEEIIKPTRKRQSVVGRYMIAYYLRKHTDATLEEIEEYLKIDHATILHGIKRINEHSEVDRYTRELKECLDNKYVPEIHKLRIKFLDVYSVQSTPGNKVEAVMRIIMENIEVFKDKEREHSEMRMYDEVLNTLKKDNNQLRQRIKEMNQSLAKLMYS